MTLLVLTAVGLQLAAIYLPPLERFFGLPPLPAGDLLIAMGMGVVTFAAVRLERLLAGRRAAAYRGAGA
jgi:Ca2+-transporting ATPase